MARRKRATRPDYDSPWKVALDHFFEPCLHLFFPDAHAGIDWSRGHVPLDKELQPILRRSEMGRKHVDKLIKVWLLDGQEQWVLVHVEVQGSREAKFPLRMHVYNHRIFDRYGREVVSLAILTDDDPRWKPSRYESSRWGFRTLTEFPVVKLLEYAGEYQRLEADPNPFAVVVLAQLKAMETRRDPERRRAWKVQLVKGLYDRGMGREEVRELFRFIDWVLELPEGLEDRFRDEMEAYQQEKKMPYMNTFERHSMAKGQLQGIEALLEIKFGAKGLELMPELQGFRDPVLLEKVLLKLKTAESPEAVRRVWTRKKKKAEPEPEQGTE